MNDPFMPDQAVHPEAERWGGWYWREPTRGEHFRRCTYCGSIHPEDLAAERAWRPEWSDMKYGWPHKFYVDIPNREPDSLYVVSTASGPEPPQDSHSDSGYVPWSDLTDDQLRICERDGYSSADGGRPAFVAFGTRPNHFGKFYTIHLSDTGLAPELKRKIERRSGLMFSFTAGRVAWQPYE